MSAPMDHIDVRSYHCPPPAESTYSTKSTADLDPARQRLIDSIINRKNSSSPYRPTTSTIKKENARFFVPNLYANQRVRQRSISRESPPPQLKKEKKAVAFGTTITIKDRRNTSLTRPSTSFINDQSNARLELQNLRLRVEANEKMRKDVDQLQRIVKSLIEENVTLAADLRQLSKIVHELHENNSFLKTKMSLLEPWHTKDDYGDAHRTRRINGHIKQTEHTPKARNVGRISNEVSRRLAHIYIGDGEDSGDSVHYSRKYSDEMDEESSQTDN